MKPRTLEEIQDDVITRIKAEVPDINVQAPNIRRLIIYMSDRLFEIEEQIHMLTSEEPKHLGIKIREGLARFVNKTK